MSELLSYQDYQAIAETLSVPTQSYIDGRYCDAVSGQTYETVNPATGQVIAQVSACGSEDVDKAVAAARRAFDEGTWNALHPAERKEILKNSVSWYQAKRTNLQLWKVSIQVSLFRIVSRLTYLNLSIL